MPPAIEIHELTKTYGATLALQPTTLSVPQGAVFALVGHNGAGKTTLIKILMNIIEPTAGTATVLGRPSSTLTGAAFERIGYVSENQDLPLWMTVRQFMDYNRPFYPVWNEEGLLQQLELPPDRKLKNLSRGMLMKAALASTLAFEPELIVLDEPFSGLDPLVRDEFIATLTSRTARANGVPATVLISSHDLGEVESFATHVGFLHQGKFLFTEELTTLTARFRDVTVTFPGTAMNTIGSATTADAPRLDSETWAATDASAATTLPAMLGPADITLPNPPPSWLMLERVGNTVHFVHSQADKENVQAQVAQYFPTATAISAEPMTLRSIFLALAKSGRVPSGAPATVPAAPAAFAAR